MARRSHRAVNELAELKVDGNRRHEQEKCHRIAPTIEGVTGDYEDEIVCRFRKCKVEPDNHG